MTSFTAELEGDGAQFILSWNSIYKALSAYSMNADDARRKAVNDLANAISAAPGGTAGPIQPWPDAPSPNIPATPPAPQASVYMSDVVSIQSGLAAMTRLSVAAEQITLLQGAADAPTAPLGPEWAQVSTLQSDIDHVSPKLSAIIPSVVGLTVKVDAQPGTTKLPTLLGHQLSDIQIAFKTASDLAALISQLPMMSDPLAPVVAALNDQLQLCVSGSADLTQLNGAVTGVATAVSSASTGLPTNKDISGFQSALSGWSQSAGMLAQSIVEGRSVNSTTKEPLHSQNEAALQSKADQLNARCAELSQLVNTVGQNADAILSQTNTIAQQLGIYASALTPIADHAHVMSAEGQASADQIASLMKTIDSLVDPLSLLLGTLSCTTQTPEKTAANQALQVLVSTARGGVSVTAGKIQSIIDSILERAIPLKQLNQDAGSANQALSPSMQAAFQQSTQALGAALSTLADAMKDDRSYTVQAGTAPPKVISNKFIDTATGVSTIALFRSLSAPVAAIPQEASA